MKARYRLACLSHRGGMFYCVDSTTKFRTSLGTKDPEEAQRLLEARNDALRQPGLNLNIARAYLAELEQSGVPAAAEENESPRF